MRLKTRYDVGNLPHAEHPNPLAERESWLCLNGKWDFYKLKTDGKKGYEGTIIHVRFSDCNFHILSL